MANNLDSLPAELIVFIAKNVKDSGHGLARIAAISRQWQTHVESIIFASFTICASDLNDFSQLLNRRRFLALRELNYRIDDIPFEDPEDLTSVRIRAETCATYSGKFTRTITDLFTLLKDKCDDENAGSSHPGIALRLRNSFFPGKASLYFLSERDGDEDSQDGDDVSDSGEESDAVPYDSDDEGSNASDDSEYDEYGPESSLRRAWLRLTSDNLPVVPAVTSFHNQDDSGTRATRLFQMIWPRSWIAITSSLPNVKKVILYAYDNERRDRKGRLAAREGFGESLPSLPSTITNVSLRYPGRAPDNQFRRPPRLTNETLGHDIFSREMGLFSQRLVSLALQGATLNFVDFFACSTQSDWPFLEKLDISEAQPASTDGTWSFAMNPNEPREDYSRNSIRSLRSLANITSNDGEIPARMDRPLEQFRTTIIPARFEEIYLAIAQAVKRMHKLVSINIDFELQGEHGGPGMHEFIYEVGHQPGSRSLSQSSSADIRVEWTIVPSIGISDKVVAAWREVGAARGASIELFVADNPDDAYDYRLIE